MTGPVRWEGVASDGQARAGVLHTAHGAVATPAFMPVGTRASVKTVDSADLEGLGADILLANTYHLMLRPGAETIAGFGGLHSFMSWSRPILTDSGGFQVFSLSPDLDEDGVTFRSTYDGSSVRLTPERSIAVQEALGSDIAMVLDVLVGLPAPRATVRAAADRTLRWSDRALASRSRDDQSLFGIVQGGVDIKMRKEFAARTAEREFDGFAVGGLSVGELPAERNGALDAVLPELPAGKARYVMGLGDTEGLLDAIQRGADMFDCVLPTRLARHGKALHPAGGFSIKAAVHAREDAPIEQGCACPTCARHSRGYLRHLFATGEPTGPRLLTLHNLHHTFDLVASARRAITDGTFSDFRSARDERRAEAAEGFPQN